MYQVGRGWGRKLVGIHIAPDTAVVSPGQTTAFTASGVFSDGRSKLVTVSWAATGGTIDSTGVFTADSTAGIYQVIGTEPTTGLTDTAVVRDQSAPVDQPAPVVATVSVSPSSTSIQVGDSIRLVATAKDAGGATMGGITFTWASSDPDVATVSSRGMVKAVVGGSATVTATAQGVSGEAAVTVTAPVPPPVPSPTGDCSDYSYTRLVPVSTASQLTSAITDARPGDLIELAPGTYGGRWTVTQSGTAREPIVLCGPRTAVLNGGSISSGSGIFLNWARYWTLIGFTVTNSLGGIGGSNASDNQIVSLEIRDVGQAAIHLRVFSKRNVIRGNSIHGTGKYVAQYGEGVYIGTAESQWCTKTDCQPDRSDSNQVIDNTISATTADGIQMMAGTTGGLIRRNTIDGAGMVAIEAAPPHWVLAMGNNVLVDSNTAVNALTHGMKVRRSSTAAAWGSGNVFRANRLDLGTSGYGIYLETPPPDGMIVKCNNVATNAGSGLSNIACTP